VRLPPFASGLIAALAIATSAAAADPPPESKVESKADSLLKTVTLSGFVQADWVVARQSSQDETNNSNGQPLNENRIVLRRGHLRADVDQGYVLGSLEIDANTVNGPQLRPIDAEVSFRWPAKPVEGEPYIMATLGLFKTPFGFEVLEADNRRPFLERSTVIRAFFPGEYDLGARIKGGWRFLDYALGIMNGDPIGERAFPGRDPNKSKDLVFRAGAHAEPTKGVRVIGGFSGVTGSGFHQGTPSTKDVLVWRDTNEDGIVSPEEITVIPGTAAAASENFHRFALGADLRVIFDVPVLGELVLRGEVVRGSNIDRGIMPADPVSTGRNLREFGWYAGFSQEITRFGMVGVRYDHYNPDADAQNQLGVNVVPANSAFSTWAFMGALRYRGGRFIAEYDRNANALGRDVNGAPVNLADDVFTLRGEMSF
jgi:hypothetical protein